jgi:hypothetical protein
MSRAVCNLCLAPHIYKTGARFVFETELPLVFCKKETNKTNSAPGESYIFPQLLQVDFLKMTKLPSGFSQE